MPKKKSTKRLFDGIASDSHLDELLGRRKAKRATDLGLYPAAHHRYRRWSEKDILWVLEVLEQLPKGYQATFLRRIKVKTSHIWYWRKRYLERATQLPAEASPVPLAADDGQPKHHADVDWTITENVKRELDDAYKDRLK